MVHFDEFLKTLKLAVKQCYQTGHFYKDKNWWKMPNFKNLNATFWMIYKYNAIYLKGPDHLPTHIYIHSYLRIFIVLYNIPFQIPGKSRTETQIQLLY